MATIMTSTTHRSNARDRLLRQLDRGRRRLAAKVASGQCAGQNDEPWFAPGLTKSDARNLCAGCRVRNGCFRLAVIEDALTIVHFDGALGRITGVRGGLIAGARTPYRKLVKQLRQSEKTARVAA